MNKYHIPVRCMSQRRVLLAVLWYSLAISILGIYYTHIQTKDKNVLLRVSNSLQLTNSALPPLKYANSISRQFLRTIIPRGDAPKKMFVTGFNQSYTKQNPLFISKGATTKSINQDSLNMMDVRNMPGKTGVNWYEMDMAINWEALEKEEFQRIKKQFHQSSARSNNSTEKPLYSQNKKNSNIIIVNVQSRTETNLSTNIRKDVFSRFNLLQPKNKTNVRRRKNVTKSGQPMNQSSSFIKNHGKSIRKSKKKISKNDNYFKVKRMKNIYNIDKLARQARKKMNHSAGKTKTVSVKRAEFTENEKVSVNIANVSVEHEILQRKKVDIEAERQRNISRELMKKELALMKVNILSPKAAAKRADGYFKVATSKNLHLHCNWCAVISSSGQLLNQSAGKEIDQFPCVIRMNTSPTKGYEDDVGSKTTVRVIGHVNLLKINESGSLQDELFVDKITAAEKNIVPWLYNVRVNKKTDKFYKVVKNFSNTFHDTEFYLLSGSKMRNAEQAFRSEIGISRREARTWLSTGWMTMLFALDICEKIHVYGLVPENYCNDRVNDSTPYHYYESDGLHECDYYKTSEEQLRYGHLFVTEKAVFGRWAVKHNISFHYPPWNLTGINATRPLETPFIKMYREAKLNETLMQELNNTKGELRKGPMGLSLRRHVIKYNKTSSKYSQFSSAMMLIMAVFLSMVAFLLLFLFLSLLLLCFYL